MLEIVGPITDVETFATANAIRELARLKSCTALDTGANARAFLMSDCQTAQLLLRRYTGMKPPELVVKSSKLNNGSMELTREV